MHFPFTWILTDNQRLILEIFAGWAFLILLNIIPFTVIGMSPPPAFSKEGVPYQIMMIVAAALFLQTLHRKLSEFRRVEETGRVLYCIPIGY